MDMNSRFIPIPPAILARISTSTRTVTAMAILAGLLALALTSAAMAQQQAHIELQDGSSLRGDVIGLENGRYRIRTRHLGVIELDQADIRSLGFGDAANATNGNGTGTGNAFAVPLAELQKGMMQDESTMNLIMGLADDPAVQAILNNPELMQSISRGDLGALSKDPAFTRLLNHPTVRQIQRQAGVPGSR